LTSIKNLLKFLLHKFFKKNSKTSIGKYIGKILVEEAMSQTQMVTHGGISLKFTVPNSLNYYRVNSFSNKEPETLAWIDSFTENSVFWDVGANIGLYSCYAAHKRGCSVISFEPSIFNLELLARNIHQNFLNEKINIMPIAITNTESVSELNLSTTEWGGALSSFGESYGQDGFELDIKFSYRTFGASLDNLLKLFDLEQPKYLKIDVDGIEHLVLKGGARLLDGVQEILIELNDGFIEQAKTSYQILNAAGFSLKEKTLVPSLEGTNLEKLANQLWVK